MVMSFFAKFRSVRQYRPETVTDRLYSLIVLTDVKFILTNLSYLTPLCVWYVFFLACSLHSYSLWNASVAIGSKYVLFLYLLVSDGYPIEHFYSERV
jgi:predicted branched-subunit amino acid permease